MSVNESAKYTLAKSFTELAIQNGLITHCEKAEDTAKEITVFFNTIVRTINSKSSEQ